MEEKRYIRDDLNHVIGYTIGDSYYNKNDKLIGHRIGNTIVNSYQMGKILYTIHDDGSVTEGTSRKIICQISDDGTITEGTSRHIVGKIDRVSTSRSESSAGIGGAGLPLEAVIIGAFLGVIVLYFSIFKLPGMAFKELNGMKKNEDIVGFVTLAIAITSNVVSCIIGNIVMKNEKFIDRFIGGFFSATIGCYLTMIVCSFFTHEFSAMIIFGGLLVAVMFSVLPTIIICPIFYFIRIFIRIVSE